MAKAKVRGIRQPHAARLAYAKELYRVIEVVEAELAGMTTMGRWDSLVNAHDSFFHTVRKKLAAQLQSLTLTVALEGIAQKTERLTDEGFQQQMMALLKGMPVIPAAKLQLRELFVRENMKLVQSLSDELLNKVEMLLLRSMRQGSPVREIEKELQHQVGLSKKRAQLIARDQVNKYSGELTRHNQQSAGITHYRWATSQDSRVRSRHRHLDGQIFAWDKAPVSDKSGGRYHPRHGYNCRCDAIPVVEK